MPVTVGLEEFKDLASALEAPGTFREFVVTGNVRGGVVITQSHGPIRITGEPGASVSSDGVPAIVVKASNVKITGITFKCENADACVHVACDSKKALVDLQNCSFAAPAGTGIKAEGGMVRVECCEIQDCGEYGFSATAGADVSCSRVSIVRSAKTGVLARGQGSIVNLCAGTIVSQNGANGVGCDEGAEVIILNCEVSDNKGVGINVMQSCNAQVTSTRICKSGMHGIVVNGGTLEVEKTNVESSGSLGMLVAGTAAAPGAAQLKLSTISSSGAHGVFVQLGGRLKCHGKSKVFKSGQSGVVAMGGECELDDVVITQNGFDGVHVGENAQGMGGSAKVSNCLVEDNRRFGISCMGAKSSLGASDCQVLGNGDSSKNTEGGHGVVVLLGAEAAVAKCTISRNLKSGLLVHGSSPQGTGSTLSLVHGTVENNSGFGASVAEGGILRIKGTTICNNELGVVEGEYTREVPQSVGLQIEIAERRSKPRMYFWARIFPGRADSPFEQASTSLLAVGGVAVAVALVLPRHSSQVRAKHAALPLVA